MRTNSAKISQKEKAIYLMVFLLSIVLMIGCLPVTQQPDATPNPTSNPTVNQIDLLSDNTCEAPCFLGITPGVTTHNEVEKIINDSVLLSGCKEYDLRSQGGVQWIDCNFKSFGITFFDGTVASITVTPLDFNVGQLIQKYGYPDAVEIIQVSRPDEPSRIKAIFYLDRIQLLVILFEKPGHNYNIESISRVEAIIFENKFEYEKFAKNNLTGWRGLGIYP